MTRLSPRTSAAVLASVLLAGCAGQSRDPAERIEAVDGVSDRVSVVTGAMHLTESGFELLSGKRVGLIANQTTRVDSVHLVDILAAAHRVQLVALFGPEHGIRGLAEAGELLEDGVDAQTGVPVFSLYGEHRSPTEAMLKGIDVLVFDVQDVGARFYTYISTMGLAMQSAARFGVDFVVLDRPNPLGGESVEGFVQAEELKSFVGLYPIPVTHGMTAGELARMIKGEQLLPDLDDLDLEVVELTGWRRDMLWPDTGLPWFPTSPNIPDFATAVVYPGTCLFEGTTGSEGRGTLHPFLTVGGEFVDETRLAVAMNSVGLPGADFRPVRFTPRAIQGMDTSPKLLGREIGGVRIFITDAARYEPVRTGTHLVARILEQYVEANGSDVGFLRRASFDERAGSRRMADALLAGTPPDDIVAQWSEDVADFMVRRTPYLLYE